MKIEGPYDKVSKVALKNFIYFLYNRMKIYYRHKQQATRGSC